MATTATTPTLPNFADRSEWERVENVQVFDEHDEQVQVPSRGKDGQPLRGKDGKPVLEEKLRKFRKEQLEEIVRRCRKRDESGVLCPLTIGHTSDDDKEQDQPEIVGYARGFKVDYSPELQRYVIRADYYLRKADAGRARQFPRTSVELWPSQKIIDPIALIKRTPQRDLPQWTYAHKGNVIRYSALDWLSTESPSRYTQETDMALEDLEKKDDKPVDEPGEGEGHEEELSPEEKKTADRFMKHYGKSHGPTKYLMSQYHGLGEEERQKYEMGGASPAMPSGTDGGMPAEVTDPEKEKAEMDREDKERMRRNGKPDRYAALESEVKVLKRANDDLLLRYQRADRKVELTALQNAGYEFDLGEELKEVEALPAEKYAAHLKRIKTRYSRSSAGQPPIDVYGGLEGAGGANGEGLDNEARFERAVRYQRSHNVPWEEAVAKTK